MIDFAALGLPINITLFAVAAAAVWIAGGRLTRYAAAISRITGIGQAVMGIILLAGITSLPEIGVTATASYEGNAKLAVNNLFGSIALQLALLAVIDFFIGRRALTAVVPEPTVLVEGSLNVVLIAFAAGAMIVGDIAFFGVGIWAWGLLFGYIASVWALSRARGPRTWLAGHLGEIEQDLIKQQHEREQEASAEDGSLSDLLVRTVVVASVILVAGFVLAQSGDVIAEQTGLGQSFVGFFLVALATSLPELSTAVPAARHGLYAMAISDILGTNIINVALIFVADLIDAGGPILNRLDDFATFGALLSVVLTGLFLAGLSERRDKSIARMGYDSLLVVMVYAGGLVLLYGLRPDA